MTITTFTNRIKSNNKANKIALLYVPSEGYRYRISTCICESQFLMQCLAAHETSLKVKRHAKSTESSAIAITRSHFLCLLLVIDCFFIFKTLLPDLGAAVRSVH